ncbi:MAG: hypothetical protein U0519_04125 [Candidatus Gracilibacteria bacterium]
MKPLHRFEKSLKRLGLGLEVRIKPGLILGQVTPDGSNLFNPFPNMHVGGVDAGGSRLGGVQQQFLPVSPRYGRLSPFFFFLEACRRTQDGQPVQSVCASFVCGHSSQNVRYPQAQAVGLSLRQSVRALWFFASPYGFSHPPPGLQPESVGEWGFLEVTVTDMVDPAGRPVKISQKHDFVVRNNLGTKNHSLIFSCHQCGKGGNNGVWRVPVHGPT